MVVLWRQRTRYVAEAPLLPRTLPRMAIPYCSHFCWHELSEGCNTGRQGQRDHLRHGELVRVARHAVAHAARSLSPRLPRLSAFPRSCIRSVSIASGIITTVAGVCTTQASTVMGDGGPATSAVLLTPFGLAVDGAGGFAFTDYGLHVVRLVSPVGIITTIAGCGHDGFSGDGVS